MKIDLFQPDLSAFNRNSLDAASWKQSAPFFRGGKVSHHVAHYWYGNTGRGEVVHHPPENRLLCSVCEANAIVHGQQTADQLAGRHVCIGRLKTERICCKNEAN